MQDHIKDILGKELIGLALSHHIMELIVSNLFKHTIEKNGCETCIFLKCQNCWENNDKSKFKSGIDDSEVLKKLNKFEKEVYS